MAHSIPRQKLTQADALRDLLEESYIAAVNSQGLGHDRAHRLLLNLDMILAFLHDLQEMGVDLRAERARWLEVQGAVRRHADTLRAELAPLGGLKTLRKSHEKRPSRTERWWWWLDVRARQHARGRLFKLLASIAAVLVLGVAAYWAFGKLFPVDPQVSLAYEHKINAENFLTTGDTAAAMTELELAHQAMPGELDIDCLLAVLYEHEEQSQKMEALLASLFASYEPAVVRTSLAQSYMTLGDVEKARPLARQAIADDPANPQGYLISGMIFEADGDTQQAVEAYQRAADVANQAQDFQTEAFAKIRLATLLQKARGPVPLPAQ